jgi:phosphoribosylaminoimidazole-succinocarboxamide synthase
VRGYLIGSGWQDYQATGKVCGIPLRRRPAAGEPAAAADLYPGNQSGHRRSRRERLLRTCAGRLLRWRSPTCWQRPARAARRSRRRRATRRSRCTARRRACRQPRHHHCRHQVRIRRRCCRHAAPDRRGADPRLVALLAGRRLSRRQQPAVLRQAVRARLSRNARLEQAAPGPHLPAAVLAGTRARYVEACERLTGESVRRLTDPPDISITHARESLSKENA